MQALKHTRTPARNHAHMFLCVCKRFYMPVILCRLCLLNHMYLYNYVCAKLKNEVINIINVVKYLLIKQKNVIVSLRRKMAAEQWFPNLVVNNTSKWKRSFLCKLS